jgi:cyclic pyranopterin phosphate synthase
MVLKDGYGRPLLNLRIAITGKCNLDCSYCHAEGEEKPARCSQAEMTAEEIARIARIAVGLGISGVKLTGGEPLMRKDIVEVVKQIAGLKGLSDLSMTTNGTLLASLAGELRASGLKRVNVNLPAVDGKVYHELTGGRVKSALEGIESAVQVGLCPVKLNMLILKGINDTAVPEMIEFAARTGTILQLIELEPLNIDSAYYSARHKSLDEYEALLKERALRVESRRYMQNRHVYHLQGVDVETVRPTENSEFCMHCTRLRVTSDGKLKTCLMRNDCLVDVLTPMRIGASGQELVELFKRANKERRPYCTA